MEEFVRQTYQRDNRVVGIANCRSVTPTPNASVTSPLNSVTSPLNSVTSPLNSVTSPLNSVTPTPTEPSKSPSKPADPLFSSTPKRVGGIGGVGVGSVGVGTPQNRSYTLPHSPTKETNNNNNNNNNNNATDDNGFTHNGKDRSSWAASTVGRSSSRASSFINNNNNNNNDNNNNNNGPNMGSEADLRRGGASRQSSSFSVHNRGNGNNNNNNNNSNNNNVNDVNQNNRGSYPSSPTSSLSGGSSFGGSGNSWLCRGCGGEMQQGEVAVCIPAEDIGPVPSSSASASEGALPFCWHPSCFTCATCKDSLADLVYFWYQGNAFCERHYAEQVKPRCAACDELIFCKQYTEADGLCWHLKHFRCQSCDLLLAGQRYVAKDQRPFCMECHDAIYAQICHTCKGKVTAESKRLDYDAFTWHATPDCFRCSNCEAPLIGKKFMCKDGYVFCSVSCKKKVYSRLAEMAKAQLEQAANATVLALQAMAVTDDDSSSSSSNTRVPPPVAPKPNKSASPSTSPSKSTASSTPSSSSSSSSCETKQRTTTTTTTTTMSTTKGPSTSTTMSTTVTAEDMETGKKAVQAPLSAKPRKKT